MHTAAVLTVSDSVTQGTRADESGDLAQRILMESGIDEVKRDYVADEAEDIARHIVDLVDTGVGLVVTTGGTGLGPRDVTPEATKTILEREAPGLGELMRSAGMAHTPLAALARGVAGVRGRTLVVNLPGSPRAVRESLDALLPVLPHALSLVSGGSEHD
jgi:molybdopterin adenylyltransferase